MSQKVIRCPDDKLALLLEHGGLNCTSEAKAVAHGIMLDLRDCRAALAAAEHERDIAVEANLSVRVCKEHVHDVIGLGCLVCDLAAAEAKLADERRHADALAGALRDPDSITVERAIEAHHARRAAEIQ